MRRSWRVRSPAWCAGAASAWMSVLVLGLGPQPGLAQESKPAEAASAPAAATSSASETGKIAWYGKKFAGRKTASGQPFNPEALTMAHKTHPFGTRVRITNPANKKSVVVVVNDRGPTQADRVGDVSYAAARKLGMTRSGVIEAQLEVVGTSPAHAKKK